MHHTQNLTEHTDILIDIHKQVSRYLQDQHPIFHVFITHKTQFFGVFFNNILGKNSQFLIGNGSFYMTHIMGRHRNKASLKVTSVIRQSSKTQLHLMSVLSNIFRSKVTDTLCIF